MDHAQICRDMADNIDDEQEEANLRAIAEEIERLKCQVQELKIELAAEKAFRGLPEIGTPFGGGFFVDLVTADGQTYALVVAPKSEDEGSLTWEQAMKRAAACRAGGFDDWRLPNRRDALAMAEKLLPTGSETPDAFREGSEHALNLAWYWTAEELVDDPGYAWLQSFDFGGQLTDLKYDSYRVRAVRRIFPFTP